MEAKRIIISPKVFKELTKKIKEIDQTLWLSKSKFKDNPQDFDTAYTDLLKLGETLEGLLPQEEEEKHLASEINIELDFNIWDINQQKGVNFNKIKIKIPTELSLDQQIQDKVRDVLWKSTLFIEKELEEININPYKKTTIETT